MTARPFCLDMARSGPPSVLKQTPERLAYCCDLCHKQNGQETLIGKRKDDPTSLLLSLHDFVANTLDIPKVPITQVILLRLPKRHFSLFLQWRFPFTIASNVSNKIWFRFSILLRKHSIFPRSVPS